MERILQNARAKTREDLCKMAREGSKPGVVSSLANMVDMKLQEWDTFQK